MATEATLNVGEEPHGLGALRGQVAVVSGASSGIGSAIARRLAARGMRLALLARRKERLQRLADELDTQVLVLPTDLRRESDIQRAFAVVRDTWGGTRILINNAGVGREAPLSQGATELWREMLEVNVLGLCICTREALRDMQETGEGHVVHVGSMAGHRVPPNSGVYGATKFAVRSLTESLRQELRQHNSEIRVSCVSPGIVQTEFAEQYLGSAAEAEQHYARFEALQPDDIARAVEFVLSQPPHVQVHDVLVRPREQST